MCLVYVRGKFRITIVVLESSSSSQPVMQETTFDGLRGVILDGLAVRLWHGLLATLPGPDRRPAMIIFCSMGRRTVDREGPGEPTNCPGGEDGEQAECLLSERSVGPGPRRIEDSCKGSDGDAAPSATGEQGTDPNGEQGTGPPGGGLTEREGIGSLQPD